MLSCVLSNIKPFLTRICSNRESLLDPMLITDPMVISELYTISVNRAITDHETTTVTLKTLSRIRQTFLREVWLYQYSSIIAQRAEIDKTDWT